LFPSNKVGRKRKKEMPRVAEDNSFRTQDESWAPGVRDFMMFVASKMLQPASSENYNQGRLGPTEHLHAFYPESAFTANVPGVTTWNGSDESHVFKGKYNNTDDGELIWRKKCVCVIRVLQGNTSIAWAMPWMEACGTAKLSGRRSCAKQ
jgi:hypothetical protein